MYIPTDQLPDVQELHAPPVNIMINQAGVEKLKLPFSLALAPGTGKYCNLVADVTITTDVNKNKKGISMSRLLLTLNKHLHLPLNRILVEYVMKDIIKEVGSENCYIKFEFDLPVEKKSPLSNYSFPIYYKCSFAGKMSHNNFRFFQGVVVQYSSYCPCSAELSKDLENKGGNHGFPHAQRSYANILAEMETNKNEDKRDPSDYIWLEDIIETVNSILKTQPYPIIKRPDEQEIARIASENPMFVEDAIRYLSKGLDDFRYIKDWIVKCSHEESIHTHDAIAVMWKGITNGFDGRKYL